MRKTRQEISGIELEVAKMNGRTSAWGETKAIPSPEKGFGWHDGAQ